MLIAEIPSISKLEFPPRLSDTTDEYNKNGKRSVTVHLPRG